MWWVKVCKRSFAATFSGTTYVSMPAHGCCERVARERAGGERGFIFACQKENRVPPSNKAASEVPAATMRRVLNAGRRNSKDCLQTRLHFCASKGVRGKAFPPKGARSAPGVQGGARRCGAGKPCIQTSHTDRHGQTRTGGAGARVLRIFDAKKTLSALRMER